MNSLGNRIGHLQPKSATVSADALTVALMDGRIISVPLVWYPRLYHGTQKERNRFELGLEGIHWPDLDEDISIEGMLLGEKSGESPRSLQRWLDERAQRTSSKVAPKPSSLQYRATNSIAKKQLKDSGHAKPNSKQPARCRSATVTLAKR
jgi:hypothetical protein